MDCLHTVRVWIYLVLCFLLFFILFCFVERIYWNIHSLLKNRLKNVGPISGSAGNFFCCYIVGLITSVNKVFSYFILCERNALCY